MNRGQALDSKGGLQKKAPKMPTGGNRGNSILKSSNTTMYGNGFNDDISLLKSMKS